MGNYDEFDLDLRVESGGNGQVEPRTSNPTTAICSLISSVVSEWTFETIMEGCSGECYSNNCPKTETCGGSGNTCTCYC